MPEANRDDRPLGGFERGATILVMAIAVILLLGSYWVSDGSLLRQLAILLLAWMQIFVNASLRSQSKLVFSRCLGFFPGVLCSVAALAAFVAWGIGFDWVISADSIDALLSAWNPIFVLYGTLQTLEAAGLLGTQVDGAS